MVFEVRMWEVYFREADKDGRLSVADDDLEGVLRSLTRYSGFSHVTVDRVPSIEERMDRVQAKAAEGGVG